MLKTIAVTDFRCFTSLRIDGLERFNLVLGANNVGKTALLEALFLHLGGFNAALPRLLEEMRGASTQSVEPEELWGWLFRGRDLNREIRIESSDDSGRGHELIVRVSTAGAMTSSAPVYSEPAFATSGVARGLRLECKFTDGVSIRSRADVADPGLSIENGPRDRFPTVIFLPAVQRASRDNSSMFSRLEQEGRTEWLTSALRRLDPRLKRLAILVFGGAPVIHADLGEPPLVPISHLGQGFGRAMSVLLAISLARDGVVLIDEIENGLYHEAMDQVWNAIREAALHANAQVFATTHSWECIRSAHAAFPPSTEANLRLVRLERIDGAIESVSYDAESLAMALKTEIEVR